MMTSTVPESTQTESPKPFTDAQQARLVFLGTKDFAVPSFERFCDGGWNVVALVTQPDRPQGRKQEIIPARIRLAAEARGIPVLQPENLNASEGLALVAPLAPDLLVTVAYGQILKPHILQLAPFGGVNLHGSLLPQYRGAAPVARSLQSGDAETGVTVIQMSPQVDAGGILSKSATPIGPDETASTLEARLGAMGAPLLEETVREYLEGKISPVHQDIAQATRAPKLSKEEARIDWSRPAFLVDRFIRAMNPWPLARSRFKPADDRPPVAVTIHLSTLSEALPSADCFSPGQVVGLTNEHIAVICGDGRSVLLKVIQTEGRKALTAAEWARGSRALIGDMFLQ